MPQTDSPSPLTGFSSQPVLDPVGELSAPAGFAAPALTQVQHSRQVSASTSLASKVLQDPLLMRLVSDRVYELMQEDLRQQQERSRDYGGRYGNW